MNSLLLGLLGGSLGDAGLGDLLGGNRGLRGDGAALASSALRSDNE